MKSSLKLILISVLLVDLLQLVSCFSDGDHHSHQPTTPNKLKKHESHHHQLSPEMIKHVKVHGVLLWASMGLLTPLGILTIRVSGKDQSESTRAKAFFYLHVIFQILSVVLATGGAVMSVRNFENRFNNHHQRIGLLLYTAIWTQTMIGFFRPQRGKKGRKVWYVVHWIVGTLVSLVGIVNIYTGLDAYHKRTLRSTRVLSLVFTAQIAFIAFLYLFQDKKEYMHKQVLVLPNLEAVSPHQDHHQPSHHKDNRLVPQPCAKQNALRNLFD